MAGQYCVCKDAKDFAYLRGLFLSFTGHLFFCSGNIELRGCGCVSVLLLGGWEEHKGF